MHSMAELADLDHPEDTGTSAYLLSLGYIPYFYVTDGEVMRAFVHSIGNAKIKAVFDQTPDDAVVETFWKYFNAYSSISEGFDEFENKFVLEKAEEWCKSNSIEYSVEK